MKRAGVSGPLDIVKRIRDGNRQPLDKLGRFLRIPGDAVKMMSIKVVSIKRFMCDAGTADLCVDAEHDPYLYDLMLNNGEVIFRAVLDTNLNMRVQKYLFKKNLVYNMKFRKVDSSLYCRLFKSSTGYFLQLFDYEEIESPVQFPDPANMQQSLAYCFPLSCINFPLIGARRYYVDVWNDAIPFAETLIPTAPPMDLGELLQRPYPPATARYDLLDICEDVPQSNNEFVLVLDKGKLHNMSKPNDRQEGTGFRCMLNVASPYSVGPVSTWGSAALQTDACAVPGAVLFIRRLMSEKEKNPDFNLKCSNRIGLPRNILERKVNTMYASNIQVPIVQKVDDGDHRMTSALPKFVLREKNYMARRWFPKEMLNVENETLHDVVGVVTKMYRPVRQKRFATVTPERVVGTPYGYWCSYWIEIMENPDTPPTPILLFINGQDTLHRSLKLGDLVVIMNLLSYRRLLCLKSHGIQNIEYFKSVTETQVALVTSETQATRYVANDHPVLEFWKNSEAVERCLNQRGAVGADLYTTKMPWIPLHNAIRSVGMNDNETWQEQAANLRLGEMRRIFVRAVVLKIIYVPMISQPVGDADRIHEEQILYEAYDPADPAEMPSNLRLWGLEFPHSTTLPHPYKSGVVKNQFFPSTIGDEEGYVKPVNCTSHFRVVLWLPRIKIKCQAFFFPPMYQGDDPPSLLRLLKRQYIYRLRDFSFFNYASGVPPSVVDASDFWDGYVGFCKTSPIPQFPPECFALLQLFQLENDELELILMNIKV